MAKWKMGFIQGRNFAQFVPVEKIVLLLSKFSTQNTRFGELSLAVRNLVVFKELAIKVYSI